MMRVSNVRSMQEEYVQDTTSIPSCAASLVQMSEYRHARGQRHPVLALLSLICVAMRCGARSPSAIADWGQDHGGPWLAR